jgi:hypothetical protein
MYNVNELAARLRNGESVDDIADELAAALNEATAIVEEEQAAKKKAYLDREAQLDSLADIIVDSFNNYLIVAEPELKELLTSEEGSREFFRETLDAMLPTLVAMLKLDKEKEKNKKNSTMEIKLKMPATEVDKALDEATKVLDNWIKSLK